MKFRQSIVGALLFTLALSFFPAASSSTASAATVTGTSAGIAVPPVATKKKHHRRRHHHRKHHSVATMASHLSAIYLRLMYYQHKSMAQHASGKKISNAST